MASESNSRRLVEAATISPRDLISVGNTSYRVIAATPMGIGHRWVIRVRSTQRGISSQHVTVHYFGHDERVVLVEGDGR